MSEIDVRPARATDREAIIRIDELCTGARKEGWWRGLVVTYGSEEGEEARTLHPEMFQVAESDGKVVGFIVGDVQSWQFGIERAGRITAIGIDPENRLQGIASRLLRSLLDTFRRMNLGQVLCLTTPGDDLDAFFRSAGFEDSQYRALERRI